MKKIKFYRGPLNNAAKRFYEILKKDVRSFLRICDSPLIDYKLIDKAITKFNWKHDLLTNIFPRSIPKGSPLKLLTPRYIEIIFPYLKKYHKEHVTTYFYDNFENFENTQTQTI